MTLPELRLATQRAAEIAVEDAALAPVFAALADALEEMERSTPQAAQDRARAMLREAP